MKKISDQKLQAYSVGSMGSRNLSKRELEELRKKEEEEAAAHVFKEFVETFQEAPSSTSKVWVKAGTYDAGARREDTSERGKLYKPTSRIEEKRTTVEDVVRSFASRQEPPRLKAKSSKDKKKSNLELFKEELRQIQEERSERHKFKNVLRDRGAVPEPAMDMMPDVGSYDTGDPNTTNLYLGNLNPKITEQQLMEIFGRYGPLASIKIMWPRSDEEKARGRNCGFVAFMSRRDGERALNNINGKEILNYEMKLGWGKAVVIPPVPIYIPPSLQTPSKPPPPSGLPFNAQPPKHLLHKIPRVRPGEYYPSDPDDKEAYEQILSQSIVKVVVPQERNILMLIHRMVEFVIREGPMFEAIIMNKELNNPFFRFLFENQSPAHVYYRWKLYSLLQGDSTKQWPPNDFRMFKGGSVWRPPVLNLYTAGMPDELVDEDETKDIRGTLSNSQRDRLEQVIRALSAERGAVGAAMAWCVEHAEAAHDVARLLHEALAQARTPPARRLARLYLLSDILHNAAAKLPHASAYRAAFQPRLIEIMRELHQACGRVTSRIQQEGFKARVTRVLQAWADCALYPTDFLQRLHVAFLTGEDKPDVGAEGSLSPARSEASDASSAGGPLDGAALRRLAELRAPLRAAVTGTAAAAVADDIDGVPVEDDIDGIPLEMGGSPPAGAGGFVPSRWESVAPSSPPSPPAPPSPPSLARAELAGALTPDHTSAPAHSSSSGGEQVLSRETLREIEVKVLQYADQLEAHRHKHSAAHQHIHSYRKKLIKKAIKEAKELEARESPEPTHRDDDVFSTSSKKSKKSREPSLSPPPKKSRHSERKSRSRSREKDRERSRDKEKERDREREREKRRRSPATPPPTHHHRKHNKHAKHKY